MKQILYLMQWFEKLIAYWQPQQLMLIESGEKNISQLWRDLLKASHQTIHVTIVSWEEIGSKMERADVCLLVFPPLDYSKEKLQQKIRQCLALTSRVLYLLASINENETIGQSIHPLQFNEYRMALWRVADEKLNLQIYAFWPGRYFEEKKSEWVVGAQLEENQDMSAYSPLHIVYYLPHIQLTGGLKCLLEQVRQLTKRGHEVSLIRRMQEGEIAFLPTWTDLKKGRDFKQTYGISEKDDVRQFIPYDTDVVMVGWFSQLNEFYDYEGKVCLWEQGSQWIFGEFGEEGLYNQNAHDYMEYIYSLAFPVLSVSKVVQEILKARYGKETQVLTCGIDTQFYYPLKEKKVTACPTILMVGSPYLPFKQLEWAQHLLERLFEIGLSFKVIWITPVPMQSNETPYQREVVVSPAQKQLAQYYREAEICLFTSLYEAFAMPPLEAMASGIPVVATNCGGIMTYAQPGQNALIYEIGDEAGMLKGLQTLLQDPILRQHMGQKGRETALAFDYQIVGKRLEQLLYEIVNK